MHDLPEPVVRFDCPKCGKEVRARRRKKDGQLFLGCTGYPECNWVGDYDLRVQVLARYAYELLAKHHPEEIEGDA